MKYSNVIKGADGGNEHLIEALIKVQLDDTMGWEEESINANTCEGGRQGRGRGGQDRDDEEDSDDGDDTMQTSSALSVCTFLKTKLLLDAAHLEGAVHLCVCAETRPAHTHIAYGNFSQLPERLNDWTSPLQAINSSSFPLIVTLAHTQHNESSREGPLE